MLGYPLTPPPPVGPDRPTHLPPPPPPDPQKFSTTVSCKYWNRLPPLVCWSSCTCMQGVHMCPDIQEGHQRPVEASVTWEVTGWSLIHWEHHGPHQRRHEVFHGHCQLDRTALLVGDMLPGCLGLPATDYGCGSARSYGGQHPVVGAPLPSVRGQFPPFAPSAPVSAGPARRAARLLGYRIPPRACMRACVCARVRVHVHARVRACGRACVPFPVSVPFSGCKRVLRP